MGSGTRAESNRLWAVMAIAAIVVVALFVVDPFGGSEAESNGIPLDDDGAPFIAVIEHRRAPARVADEPAEVLDVVIEADAMTKPVAETGTVDGTGDRGQRTAADE